MSENEELIRLKIKLAEILCTIQWLMSDDEFYERFHDTINYIGDYW